MNPKVTVLLAVVAAVLVWFLVFDKEKVAEEKKQAELDSHFVNFEADDVMKLTVTRHGKPVTAERRGDTWHITEPFEWPGDKYAWGAIAHSLTTCDLRGTYPEEGETITPEDMKNWGLADPPLKIAATIREESREYQFTFGNNPLGSVSSCYATKSSAIDKVFAVEVTIKGNADKDLNDLRDRGMLPVKFGNHVTRIEVSNQDLAFVAERQPNKNWLLVKPSPGRAVEAELKKLVEKLNKSASTVIDDPGEEKLREVGLADDQLESASRYAITTSKGTTQTFYVGQLSLADQGYVGRNSDSSSLFVIPKEFFSDQPTTVGKLRPTKASYLETWNTDIVSATSEGSPLFKLEKPEFGWVMTYPHSATAERDAVNSIITAFKDHHIMRYIDSASSDSQLGLDPPRLVVEIAAEGTGEKVMFGKAIDEDRIYAGLMDAPDRFIVKRALYDEVFKQPSDLLTEEELERLDLKPDEEESEADSEEGESGMEELDEAGSAAEGQDE